MNVILRTKCGCTKEMTVNDNSRYIVVPLKRKPMMAYNDPDPAHALYERREFEKTSFMENGMFIYEEV